MFPIQTVMKFTFSLAISKKLATLRGLLLAALVAMPISVQANPNKVCGKHLVFGAPNGADQILCRNGYAVGYNYTHKIPIWASYHITNESAHGANVPRKKGFNIDKEIPHQHRSRQKDYSHSGHDRGHLAPSATIDYSRSANDETFLYSNMVPQLPGFNRDMHGHTGAWGKSESLVRKWVRARGELYVISGAVLSANDGGIGSGVTVPAAFYKIVLDPNKAEAIALLMPHRENAKNELPSYITSIDQIEAFTGIDFFSLIDDKQEGVIEARVQESLW